MNPHIITETEKAYIESNLNKRQRVLLFRALWLLHKEFEPTEFEELDSILSTVIRGHSAHEKENYVNP